MLSTRAAVTERSHCGDGRLATEELHLTSMGAVAMVDRDGRLPSCGGLWPTVINPKGTDWNSIGDVGLSG